MLLVKSVSRDSNRDTNVASSPLLLDVAAGVRKGRAIQEKTAAHIMGPNNCSVICAMYHSSYRLQA